MTSPTPPATVRRLAILGAWAPHRSEASIARAGQQLGLTTAVFDILRRSRQMGGIGRAWVERTLHRFNPDLVLVTRHAVRMGMTRLSRITSRYRTVFWFFDASPQVGVMELAGLVDQTYLTTAAQLERWRVAGLSNTLFLPQALDPELDKPGRRRTEFLTDVSFIGSGPYPMRWPLLRRIAQSGSRLQIRGPSWENAPADLPVSGGEVHGPDFADVVASATISLGAHATTEQASELGSASNRMWKVMGCGGAYLGPWVPGIEEFARDHLHCAWYRDENDALARIEELLRHPDETRAMAERGRQHALDHHTYRHRLDLLLRGEGYPLPRPTSV